MRKLNLATVLLAGSLIFIGCSDDGDSNGSGNYLTGEPVVIATATDAANAISAVSSADSSALSLSSSRAPSRAPVNETEQCSGGGTTTYVGDADDYRVDITTTYYDCVVYDTTTNGALVTTGTNNNGDINLRVVMKDYETVSPTESFLMNLTSDLKWNENVASYNMDMLMNGTASYTMVSPSDVGKVGYENLHLIMGSDTLDINGKVSSQSSAHRCTDGIYSLDTTTLLRMSSTYNGFDSGTMIINDTTFIFNSDNTATVTFADGSTAVVQQNAEIICN